MDWAKGFREFIQQWMPPTVYPNATWHATRDHRISYLKPLIKFRLMQYKKAEGKDFDFDCLKEKVKRGENSEWNKAIDEIKQAQKLWALTS